MAYINKFPNENVPNSEKDSLDFALKYGKAILEAHRGDFSERKSKFDTLRQYAKANQPIKKYKDIVCNEYVSVKYLSVNWDKRVNILPRFLRKAMNGVDISEFEERIIGLNAEANSENQKKKQEKIKLLNNKDFLAEVAQMNGGQSPVPQEMIPDSMAEIELDSVTKDRTKLEQGEELLINAVKGENQFDYIFNRVKKDVFNLGVGVVECYTDSKDGIQLKYTNPDYWGHSPTQDPYFRDCVYFHQRKKITLRELRKICEQGNVEISEKDITAILGANGFNRYDPIDPILNINDGQLIEVMTFTFKTYRSENYKKKKDRATGKLKLINRTDNPYNPNPNYKSDVSEKVENSYDVWYEGIMTTSGKEMIISYNLAENMAEFKGNIIPRFIACAPRIDEFGYNSLTEEAMPIIDEIQVLDYKRQQLFSELKGSITDIDADGIADITLGKKKLKPQEVLELYFSKSIRLRKTIDSEGNPINSAPNVQENPTGIPYAVREVVGEIVRQSELMNNIFGYRGSDESRPNDDTLFDTEPYRLSDNLTLKDLVDCLLNFSCNVSQAISSRMDDVFKHLEVKEKYISMIGTDDIEIIEKFRKERALSYFGSMIGYTPTKQDRIQIITDINTALGQGQISLIDAMELRQEKNIHIATRRLKLRMDQYAKKAQENEMAKINGQANSNGEAARISQEAKQQTLQLEYGLKGELEKLKAQNKLQESEVDGQLKLQLQAMGMENKAQALESQRQFDATIKKYSKEMELETRLKVNADSKKDQSKLLDQRQGKIDGFYDQEDKQPYVDLSTL